MGDGGTHKLKRRGLLLGGVAAAVGGFFGRTGSAAAQDDEPLIKGRLNLATRLTTLRRAGGSREEPTFHADAFDGNIGLAASAGFGPPAPDPRVPKLAILANTNVPPNSAGFGALHTLGSMPIEIPSVPEFRVGSAGVSDRIGVAGMSETFVSGVTQTAIIDPNSIIGVVGAVDAPNARGGLFLATDPRGQGVVAFTGRDFAGSGVTMTATPSAVLGASDDRDVVGGVFVNRSGGLGAQVEGGVSIAGDVMLGGRLKLVDIVDVTIPARTQTFFVPYAGITPNTAAFGTVASDPGNRRFLQFIRTSMQPSGFEVNFNIDVDNDTRVCVALIDKLS
jgi:hypothetical protein